jgi:arylformamidase
MMALDLNFSDLQERDRQYTARDTVPDFMQFVREYTALSDAAKRTLPCRLDIPYGAADAERMDLFPARAGSDPAPALVFIHGGYWRALSKNESGFMAPVFTEAGVAIAAIDYGLAPDTRLDTIVMQCRHAIAHLYRHAREYGIDPQRIHIAGSSAGAHLCGMLLASGWQAGMQLPDNVIAGASMLSGLFDLEPLCETHINQWLQLTPQQARMLSPVHHLPEYPCALLLSVGSLEREGFQRQTQAYQNALTDAGKPALIIPGSQCHHFDLPLQLAQPDSPLTRAVLATIFPQRSATAAAGRSLPGFNSGS